MIFTPFLLLYSPNIRSCTRHYTQVSLYQTFMKKGYSAPCMPLSLDVSLYGLINCVTYSLRGRSMRKIALKPLVYAIHVFHSFLLVLLVFAYNFLEYSTFPSDAGLSRSILQHNSKTQVSCTSISAV